MKRGAIAGIVYVIMCFLGALLTYAGITSNVVHFLLGVITATICGLILTIGDK